MSDLPRTEIEQEMHTGVLFYWPTENVIGSVAGRPGKDGRCLVFGRRQGWLLPYDERRPVDEAPPNAGQ